MTDPSAQTVLIVEDTLEVANLIQITLRKLGVNLHHASNGPDALAFIAQQVPDLILLDIGMPGMDGWDFLDRLHKQTDAQIPIVVLTAYTDSGNRQTGELMQVDAFLAKPVIPAKLREVVTDKLGLN